MFRINKILFKLLFVLLVILSVGCTNKIEEIKAFATQQNYPDIAFHDFETTYSSNALLQFNLSAPILLGYNDPKDPYYVCPKGIYIITYDENMEIKSTLKSDYAIYYENKKLAKVERNVVLTNSTGDVLQAEYLFLDEVKRKIYSDAPVKFSQVNGSGMTAKQSFESDLEFRIYRFVGVKGVQIVKDFFEEKKTDKTTSPENIPK